MWYSVSLIHLGKLQVAADSAQLRNRTSENAATLYFWEGCVSLQYCHCMQLQLHATQGNSRKLTFKHVFLQEKPEHGHDDGHSLWLKSFWYLIFHKFALTSKGHVSLASEYKCLHHSHPFCMFFSQLLDDQPQVSTQVCLALPPCPWPWTLPSTHTTVFCANNCILYTQLYFSLFCAPEKVHFVFTKMNVKLIVCVNIITLCKLLVLSSALPTLFYVDPK